MPLHLDHHSALILHNEHYSPFECHTLWCCRQAETILTNILHLQGILHHQDLKKVTQNDSKFNFNTQRTQQNSHNCWVGWLTPCSRVLLEKLTVSHLVKEFPVFCRTQKFVTMFRRVCHISLCWTTYIRLTISHLISLWSVLIIPTYLWLGRPHGLLPSHLPTKTLYIFPFYPNQLILHHLIPHIILGKEYKSQRTSLHTFLHSPVTTDISLAY
jgi:hypothetical protein